MHITYTIHYNTCNYVVIYTVNIHSNAEVPKVHMHGLDRSPQPLTADLPRTRTLAAGLGLGMSGGLGLQVKWVITNNYSNQVRCMIKVYNNKI
jgi:hypothetical protein